MEIITINKVKGLKPEEISDKIVEVQKKLFELKFKQATKQQIKTHLFKKHKNMLAQLLTVQHQFKNSTQ